MRSSDWKVALMGAFIWLAMMNARADSLGVVGPVYPITEPDMMERIKAKLMAKQASGEMERRNKEAQQHARAVIEHIAVLLYCGVPFLRMLAWPLVLL